ncbi:hypothetical protein SAMN02910398_03368 [Butyrivibrio sp. YAB3001]|nr:hypothetical protein SAMN02910398_03368 [Butyrivibrio sp. YAB3001]
MYNVDFYETSSGHSDVYEFFSSIMTMERISSYITSASKLRKHPEENSTRQFPR